MERGLSPARSTASSAACASPARAPSARSRPSRRGWLLRAGVALTIALAGAAVAVAATSSDGDSAELVTATATSPRVPTTSTVPAPEGGPSGIVEWPTGEDGWTIVLASLPQTEGRRIAVARTRQARRKGLSPVGILDSSQLREPAPRLLDRLHRHLRLGGRGGELAAAGAPLRAHGRGAARRAVNRCLRGRPDPATL